MKNKFLAIIVMSLSTMSVCLKGLTQEEQQILNRLNTHALQARNTLEQIYNEPPMAQEARCIARRGLMQLIREADIYLRGGYIISEDMLLELGNFIRNQHRYLTFDTDRYVPGVPPTPHREHAVRLPVEARERIRRSLFPPIEAAPADLNPGSGT